MPKYFTINTVKTRDINGREVLMNLATGRMTPIGPEEGTIHNTVAAQGLAPAQIRNRAFRRKYNNSASVVNADYNGVLHETSVFDNMSAALQKQLLLLQRAIKNAAIEDAAYHQYLVDKYGEDATKRIEGYRNDPNFILKPDWLDKILFNLEGGADKFREGQLENKANSLNGRIQDLDIGLLLSKAHDEFIKNLDLLRVAQKQLLDLENNYGINAYNALKLLKDPNKKSLAEYYNDVTSTIRYYQNKVASLSELEEAFKLFYNTGTDGDLEKLGKNLVSLVKSAANDIYYGWRDPGLTEAGTEITLTDRDFELKSREDYLELLLKNPQLTKELFRQNQGELARLRSKDYQNALKKEWDAANAELLDFRAKHLPILDYAGAKELLFGNSPWYDPNYLFYVMPHQMGISINEDTMKSYATQAAGAAGGALIGGATGGVPGAITGASIGWNIGALAATPYNVKAALDENEQEGLDKRTLNWRDLMQKDHFGGVDNYNAVSEELGLKYKNWLIAKGYSPEFAEKLSLDETNVWNAAVAGIIKSDNPGFVDAGIQSMRGISNLIQNDNMRTFYGEGLGTALTIMPIGGSMLKSLGGQFTKGASRVLADTKFGTFVSNTAKTVGEKTANITGKAAVKEAEKSGISAAVDKAERMTASATSKRWGSKGKEAARTMGLGWGGEIIGGAAGRISGYAAGLAKNALRPKVRNFLSRFVDDVATKNEAARLALKDISRSKLYRYGLKPAVVLFLDRINEATEEGVQYLNAQYDPEKAGWSSKNPGDINDLIDMMKNDFNLGVNVFQAYLSLFGIGDSALANDQDFWSNVGGGFAMGGGHATAIHIASSARQAMVEHNIKNELVGDAILAREGHKLERNANAAYVKLAFRNNEEAVTNVIKDAWRADAKRERDGGERQFSDLEWSKKLNDAKGVMLLAKDSNTRQMLEKLGIKKDSPEYADAIADIYEIYDQLALSSKERKDLNLEEQLRKNSTERHQALRDVAEKILNRRGPQEEFLRQLLTVLKDAEDKSNKSVEDKEETEKEKSDRLNSVRQQVTLDFKELAILAILNDLSNENDLAMSVLAAATALKQAQTAKLYYDNLSNNYGIKVRRADGLTMQKALELHLKKTIETANSSIKNANHRFKNTKVTDVDAIIKEANEKITSTTGELDEDVQHLGVAQAMLSAHDQVYRLRLNRIYQEYQEVLDEEAKEKTKPKTTKRKTNFVASTTGATPVETEEYNNGAKEQGLSHSSATVNGDDVDVEFNDGYKREKIRRALHVAENQPTHRGRYRKLLATMHQQRMADAAFTAMAGDKMRDSIPEYFDDYSQLEQKDLEASDKEAQSYAENAKMANDYMRKLAELDQKYHSSLSNEHTDENDDTAQRVKEILDKRLQLKEKAENKSEFNRKNKLLNRRIDRVNRKARLADLNDVFGEKILAKKEYSAQQAFELWYHLYDRYIKNGNNGGKFKFSQPTYNMAVKVFQVASMLGITISFGETLKGPQVAQYLGGKVKISTNITKFEPLEIAKIILHEYIHSVTSYVLNAFNDGTLKKGRMFRAALTLARIREALIMDASLNKMYNFKNTNEFVAALSDPSFRELLDSLKLPRRGLTFWGLIKAAIKNLFFGPSTASAEIDNALSYILENYDRALYENRISDKLDPYDDDEFANAIKETSRQLFKETTGTYTFDDYVNDVADMVEGVADDRYKLSDYADLLLQEYNRARLKRLFVVEQHNRLDPLGKPIVNFFTSIGDSVAKKAKDLLGKLKEEKQDLFQDKSEVSQPDDYQKIISDKAARVNKELSKFGCTVVTTDTGIEVYPQAAFMYDLDLSTFSGYDTARLVFKIILESKTKKEATEAFSRIAPWALDKKEIQDCINNHLGLKNWAYYTAAVYNSLYGNKNASALVFALQIKNLTIAAFTGSDVNFKSLAAGAKDVYNSAKKLADLYNGRGWKLLDTSLPLYGKDYNGNNISVDCDLLFVDPNGKLHAIDVTSSYRNLYSKKEATDKYNKLSPKTSPISRETNRLHAIESILHGDFGSNVGDLGYISIQTSSVVDPLLSIAGQKIYLNTWLISKQPEEEKGVDKDGKLKGLKIRDEIIVDIEKSYKYQGFENPGKVKDADALYSRNIALFEAALDSFASDIPNHPEKVLGAYYDFLNKAKAIDRTDLESLVYTNELLEGMSEQLQNDLAVRREMQTHHSLSNTAFVRTYPKSAAGIQKDELTLMDTCDAIADIINNQLPDYPVMPTAKSVPALMQTYDKLLDLLSYADDIFATFNVSKQNEFRHEYQLIKSCYQLIIANGVGFSDVSKISEALDRLTNPDIVGAAEVIESILWANEYFKQLLRLLSATQDPTARDIKLWADIMRTFLNRALIHGQYLAKQMEQQNKKEDPNYKLLTNSLRDGRNVIRQYNLIFNAQPDTQYNIGEDEIDAINSISVEHPSYRLFVDGAGTTNHIFPAYEVMRNRAAYGAISNRPDFRDSLMVNPSEQEKSARPDGIYVTILCTAHDIANGQPNAWLIISTVNPNTGLRKSKKENGRWINGGEIRIPFINELRENADLTEQQKLLIKIDNMAARRFIAKVLKSQAYVDDKNHHSHITFDVNLSLPGIHYDVEGKTRNVFDVLLADKYNHFDPYTITADAKSMFGVVKISNRQLGVYEPGKKSPFAILKSSEFRKQQYETFVPGAVVYFYKTYDNKRIATQLSITSIKNIGNKTIHTKLANLIARKLRGEKQVDGYSIDGLLNMCLYINDRSGKTNEAVQNISNRIEFTDKNTVLIKTKTGEDSNGKPIYSKKEYTPLDELTIAQVIGELPFNRREDGLNDFFLKSKNPILVKARQEIQSGKNSIELPNGIVLTKDDFFHRNENAVSDGTTLFGWYLRNGVLTSAMADVKLPLTERQISITNFRIVKDENITTEENRLIEEAGASLEEIEREQYEWHLQLIRDMLGTGTPQTGLNMVERSGEHRVQRSESEQTTFGKKCMRVCAKMLGKSFVDNGSLKLLEGREILGTTTQNEAILGRCMAEMIQLSLFAPSSAIYHECFHRIVELCLPDKMRERLYSMYREKIDKYADERSAAEGIADLFTNWVESKDRSITNVIKTEGINKHSLGKIFAPLVFMKTVAATYGFSNACRLLMLYKAAYSGVFKFLKPSQSRIDRFNKMFNGELYYSIKNTDNGIEYDFESIRDIELLDRAVTSLATLICQRLYQYGMPAYDEVEITPNRIIRMLGSRTIKTLSGREIIPNYNKEKKRMLFSDVPENKLRISQKFYREVFKPVTVENDGKKITTYPALSALTLTIANKMTLILKGSSMYEKDNEDDYERAARINTEQFDSSAYEMSRMQKANNKAKMFLSSFLRCTYVKNKRTGILEPMPTFDKDGFLQPYSAKEIMNTLYYKVKDCRSLDEMINIIKKEAEKKQNPIFELVYNKLAVLYNNYKTAVTYYDKTGKFDYDTEAFLVSVFNALTGQNITFLIAVSNIDRRTNAKTTSVVKCNENRDLNKLPTTWTDTLILGVTSVFMQQHAGGELFFNNASKDNGKGDLFHRIADHLENLQQELLDPNVDSITIDGEKLDLNDPAGIYLLEVYVCKQFWKLGITQMKPEVLEYILDNEDRLTGYDRPRRIASMLGINDTESNISIKTFIDRIRSFSKDGRPIRENIDPRATANTINPNKDAGFKNNGYAKWLATWISDYQTSISEKKVLLPGDKNGYAQSLNSCMSDELTFINKSFDTEPNGDASSNDYVDVIMDARNKYALSVKDVDIDGQTRKQAKGSIIAKSVYAWKNAKDSNTRNKLEKLKLELCVMSGFRSGQAKNDLGIKYTEQSSLQDYINRFQALQQGYLVFPTTSDKSTFVYIKGLHIPGIQWEGRSDLLVAKSGMSLFKIEHGYRVQYMPDEVFDQIDEYAQTERDLIEKTIDDLKTMKDEDKVKNYHTDNTSLKDQGIIVEPNGTRFLSFCLLMRWEHEGDDQNKGWSIKRINLNDPTLSSKDMLALADKEYFNLPREQRKEIMSITLLAAINRDILFLIDNDAIDTDSNYAKKNGWNNLLLDSNYLNALYKVYKKDKELQKASGYENNTQGYSKYCKKLAIYSLVADGTYRQIISTLESFRWFIGNPAFFDKISYDKDKKCLKSYKVDISKRIGGLMSTGDENCLGLFGIDDSYNCAVLQDFKIPSRADVVTKKNISDHDVKKESEKSLLEREFVKQNVFQRVYDKIIHNRKLLSRFKEVYNISGFASNDEIYDKFVEETTGEHTTKDVVDAINDPDLTNTMNHAVDKANKYVHSLTDGTNVTDGAAYITLDFAVKLLRMRGAWNSKYQKAYDILKNNPNTIEESEEAYKLLYTGVNLVNFVTTKYTAYGMRSSTDGTATPYYDKYSLAILTPGMLYGKLGIIYNAMINNKDAQGNSDPIDMVMMDSAIKVGSQGAVKINEDGTLSGPLNTFTQNISLLRRQLNTDPNEKDDLTLGTQMIKIVLSLINNSAKYKIDGKEVRGRLIASNIMNSIKELSRLGSQQLKYKFFNQDGSLNEKEFSSYMILNLGARNASAELLQAFSLDESGHLNMPIAATSDSEWIQSIITATINKHLVDVITPGNSFVQRSVFNMQGENAINKETGEKLYNGKPLLMFNNKNSCDCVVSLDYFRGILPRDKKDKNGKVIVNGVHTFKEAREWLIKNKIIGEEADPMTIGYRIPTQAVSSIHALRIVDVVDVVKDTVILPEEWTTITGSDFDIDHLYLASYNQTFDGTPLTEIQELLNIILKNMMALLQSSDTNFVTLYRSIDDDTSLVKSIASMIPDDDNSTSLAYSFDTLATLVLNRSQFLTGKFGIGPYALNVTNHVLTMLYGVHLPEDEFSVATDTYDLSVRSDDEDNEIMSWLSGFINAHVDIVKDPYISKLNINNYTWNISNLLTRTGHGRFGLEFCATPIMKKIARVEMRSRDAYLLTEKTNASLIKRIGYANLLLKLFSDDLIQRDGNGNPMLDRDGNTISINIDPDDHVSPEDTIFSLYGISPDLIDYNKLKRMIEADAAATVMSNRNVLEYVMSHPEIDIDDDREIPVTRDDGLEKKITFREFNKDIYLANIGFLNLANNLNNLVQRSKIDTKKYGTDMLTLTDYFYNFDKLEEQRNAWEGLDEYLSKSWIELKTNDVHSMLTQILGTLILEATPLFSYAYRRLVEHGVNKKTAQTVMKNMKSAVMSEFFVRYAKAKGYGDKEISQLFYGNNSVANVFSSILWYINNTDDKGLTLARLKHNYLLNNLTYSDEYDLSGMQFLKISLEADGDKVNSDQLSLAWLDLLNDQDPGVRDFAQRLILYAFFTSGSSKAWGSLFQYVPTKWKLGDSFESKEWFAKNVGCTYADFVKQKIYEFNTRFVDAYDDKSFRKLAKKISVLTEDSINLLMSNERKMAMCETDDAVNNLMIQVGGQSDIYKIASYVNITSNAGKTKYYIAARDNSQIPTMLISDGNTTTSEFIRIKWGLLNLLFMQDGYAKDINKNKIHLKYILVPTLGYENGSRALIYQYGFDLYMPDGTVRKRITPYSSSIPLSYEKSLNGFIEIDWDSDENRAALNRNIVDYTKVSDDKHEDKKSEEQESKWILTDKKWTREEAEKDSHTLYIFTDNTDRTSGNNTMAPSWYTKRYGLNHYPGKTSAVIRGLPNAMPISTMHYFTGKYYDPATGNRITVELARWHDKDFDLFKAVIDQEFKLIIYMWDTGIFTRIVSPANGILGGNIASITKDRTPQLYNYLLKKLDALNKYVETGVYDEATLGEHPKLNLKWNNTFKTYCK